MIRTIASTTVAFIVLSWSASAHAELPRGCYAAVGPVWFCKHSVTHPNEHKKKHKRHHHRQRKIIIAKRAAPVATSSSWSGEAPWLAEAKRHLGASGSIVGMSRAWCGAFMRLVMRTTGNGDLRSGNLAREWSRYGQATAARPGAIAVMRHHVGIVDRVVPGGVILVSGNHGRRVGAGFYSFARIASFRWPT